MAKYAYLDMPFSAVLASSARSPAVDHSGLRRIPEKEIGW